MRRETRTIRASGWFDEAWYARAYPDVRAPDLARHYLALGAEEGRSPGPRFDGPGYLAAHPDAVLRGINPLVHFLSRGRAPARDGRASSPPPPPLLPATPDGYARWRALTRPFPAPMAGTDAFAVRRDGERLPDTEWVIVLGAGAVLLPGALPAFARCAATATPVDVVTADEEVTEAGTPVGRFKPSWDPDLLLATGYAGQGIAVRASLMRELSFDTIPDLSTLLSRLAVTVEPWRARHLPFVAFSGPSPAWDEARADAAARGIGARLESGRRLRYALPDPPPVSVIIPTRDHAALLRRCMSGLLERTDYPALRVTIVDNGSRTLGSRRLLRRLARDPRVQVIRRPEPFDWSALTNAGVRASRGEVLLLMNNDVFVRHPDWLREMVSLAVRPEVGAVGATLLYPKGTVQHAGLTLHPPGLAAHLLRRAPPDEPGPCGALLAVRAVAGVTGACLALRRSVFEAVGGLAEGDLPVTLNDVDLSLRIRMLGLRVLCTPFARLTHREGVSRGRDRAPASRARRLAEWQWLHDHWGALLSADPHLNPNYAVARDQLWLRPGPA